MFIAFASAFTFLTPASPVRRVFWFIYLQYRWMWKKTYIWTKNNRKRWCKKKITHLADTYKFSTLTSWTPLKYYCAMTCWYLQPPPLSPIGGFCIFPSSSYLLTVLFSEISDIMCFFTKLVNFLARTPGKFIHILTIKNCQSWTVLAEFFLVVLLSEILKVEKSENIIRS